MKRIIRNNDLCVLSSLALITFAVYAPVLGFAFVDYDDFSIVVRNPFLQHGITIDGIVRAFSYPYEANWIPISWLSHMLDVQIFGMNPAGHHATNLLLHVGNTVLLYILLRWSTKRMWPSAAVAFLFALHPLHVESVAWVAERKDVLSTFFLMLTMLAYIHYVSMPAPGRYLIVLLLVSLGLMTKPMLVTLPIVLLLMDWWPLRRVPGMTADRRMLDNNALARLIAEKIPFAILSIGASIVTYLAQHDDISHKLSLLEKIERAMTSYVLYLYKMIWPIGLSVIYPFSNEPPVMWHVILAATLLLSVAGAALLLHRRAPYVLVGWFWYIVTLVPVIGLVQIGHHSIADRYTYIPLIGIFILLVWGAADFLEHMRNYRTVLLVPVVLVFGTLAVLTRLQLEHWKNSVALFSHAVQVTQGNWIAHNNLGKVLLDEGRTEDAIYHFKRAVEANPAYALAFVNMGFAYYFNYNFDAAREAFERAIQSDPTCHPGHFGLGLIYLALGKPELVRSEYEKLVKINSKYAVELMNEIIANTRQQPSAGQTTRASR